MLLDATGGREGIYCGSTGVVEKGSKTGKWTGASLTDEGRGGENA